MTDQTELDSMTFGQFKRFAHAIPGGESVLSFTACNSYEVFISNLYKHIDKIIGKLQDSRQHLQKDCEDRLNTDIVNTLSCIGYTAFHDPQIGGHCDMYVEYDDFQWIGEAKIYKDYGYVNDGFLQLSTRYTTGGKNRNQGGLLIYIKEQNASKIMDTWQNKLKELNQATPITVEKDDTKSSGFFSYHAHKTSGDLYKTRHIPVLLYFKPEDRSARDSEKRRQQKKAKQV